MGQLAAARCLPLALALGTVSSVAVGSGAAVDGSAFAAVAAAARARCEADPDSVVENARVAAYDGLRVNCHPPLGAPPCISEAFFHTKSTLAVNYLGQGGGPKDFAVCRRRPRYEDWPTAEPHVPLSARPGDGHTRTAADVNALLGPERKVLVIGASTAQQLHDATLCSLASAPGDFAAHRAQWHFWRRNKYREASGGCTRAAAVASCARRNITQSMHSPMCEHYMLSDKCFSNGTAFGDTIDRFDVVIVAFDPQHYGGSHIQLRDWLDDMNFLFLELSRWSARHEHDPRRAAFVREGSALHFVGGQYRKPLKFNLAAAGSGGSGGGGGGGGGPLSTCVCVHADNSWAHNNQAWSATVGLNHIAERNPKVHVLHFYNATLPRDDMHKGDMCSYRMRRVNGVATAERAGAAAAGGGRGASAAAGAARTRVRTAALRAAARQDGASGVSAAGNKPARRGRRLSIRPIRACCDCLHMCYSPQFYDQTFFTPIWHTLVREHGYEPAPHVK
ncbi:hypothetical protein KFE25_000033 [Diacronema lutheri]|uniref:Uncharacterized protein n=1 Tax=Diacronema lutheri TaxID=2081491 RepID=A0A8J6CBM9_DIALT|nr:hypothetical protein KFE25_000033 [Diacronema lutheri]